MDKKTASLVLQLKQELEQERLCCDQLAEALVQGGVDRQFQALLHHEVLRNGLAYPNVKVGQSPEGRKMKAAKRGKQTYRRAGHPSSEWQKRRNEWMGFDCKPFDQEQYEEWQKKFGKGKEE